MTVAVSNANSEQAKIDATSGSRRPREGGDPYPAAMPCGTAFVTQKVWWLWVPACAGTTPANVDRCDITFSLRFGTGGLHHHRPSLLVAVDVSRIVRGRAGRDLGAVGDEPALDLVARERLAQRLIEPLDDRVWRAGGRHDAVVERGLEIGQARGLGDGGLVGLEARALGAGDCKHAQLALRHRPVRRRDRGERHR